MELNNEMEVRAKGCKQTDWQAQKQQGEKAKGILGQNRLDQRLSRYSWCSTINGNEPVYKRRVSEGNSTGV